jgi:hypothetical protein
MLLQQLPILSLSLIDLRDSSSIAISDLSTYSTVPTSANVAMQITPPGYPTVNVTFNPGVVNVYKCADLGITCSDSCTPLPDGIYGVVYTVTGVTIPASTVPASGSANPSVDQKFIKIDTIKCKYQHAFLKVDLECGCHDPAYANYMNELRSIKLYIDGSVAECNNGNYRLSYEFYNKANTMLDRLSCKFPASKWKQCSTC